MGLSSKYKACARGNAFIFYHTMSDIICTFTVDNNSTGYFLLEKNASLHQLTRFIRTNLLPDVHFTLLDATLQPIENNAQLKNLLTTAAAQDSPFALNIVSEPEPVVEEAAAPV